MARAAKEIAPEAPAVEAHPHDECVCTHHRDSHSGKGEKKKCTRDVLGLERGKCDCVEFRMKGKR